MFERNSTRCKKLNWKLGRQLRCVPKLTDLLSGRTRFEFCKIRILRGDWALWITGNEEESNEEVVEGRREEPSPVTSSGHRSITNEPFRSAKLEASDIKKDLTRSQGRTNAPFPAKILYHRHPRVVPSFRDFSRRRENWFHAWNEIKCSNNTFIRLDLRWLIRFSCMWTLYARFEG